MILLRICSSLSGNASVKLYSFTGFFFTSKVIILGYTHEILSCDLSLTDKDVLYRS